MASEVPDGHVRKDVASLRLERMKAQTPFWSILPELTAGRAFLWGSALAVFGSAMIAKLACMQMDIRTLDELKEKLPTKMEELLSPSANALSAQLSPLGGKLKDANDEQEGGMFSEFTRSMRIWMKASK